RRGHRGGRPGAGPRAALAAPPDGARRRGGRALRLGPRRLGQLTTACHTRETWGMTMLRLRVADTHAAERQRVAEGPGLERAELLRDALHRHLTRLRSEMDVENWERLPLSDSERSLERIADWGPAEDWTDWDDAAG